MWSDYSEDEVLDLVARIYDAALDPEAWPQVMADIRRLFDGAGVLLFGTDSRTNSLTGVIQDNMPSDGMAEYDQHYLFIDPRVRFTKTFPDKKVAHDYLFTSDDEIRRNEYYDWLARHGFRYFMGTRIQVTDELAARFAIQFSPRQQDSVNSDSIRLLELLLPHVERALQVNQRLNVVETSLAALMELSQSLPQGVILLSKQREVFYMNEPAEELLRQRDGLTLRRRRIAALRASENDRLNACVNAAYRMHDQILSNFDGLLEISRPTGKRNLTLIVVPVRSRTLVTHSSERVVMILINNPSEFETLPAEELKRVHGLTAAEARLAAALLRGLSLRAYATEARITENTARWQLKQILSKTGTHRQSDLIRLILTGPARLIRPRG